MTVKRLLAVKQRADASAHEYGGCVRRINCLHGMNGGTMRPAHIHDCIVVRVCLCPVWCMFREFVLDPVRYSLLAQQAMNDAALRQTRCGIPG